MNGIHPNLIRAATSAVFAALLCGGCHSTSSGIANNPFMSPDRVAPPSTRMLAPGQAQPYYQGDPLPVMQSSTTPPHANSLTSAEASAARSATGKTLAWNTPASGNPAPAAAAAPNNYVSQVAAPSGTGGTPAAATPIASEAPVAVPIDTSDLRFAMPPAASQNVEPVTTAAATAPLQQLQQPTIRAPGAVIPASYNAPAAGGLQPLVGQPQLSSTPQVESPWRTPQMGQAIASSFGQPPSTVQQLQITPPPGMQQLQIPAQPVSPVMQPMLPAPTNVVAVQMRAVPSPPQPGDPTPRIRIPGYEVPQTAAADGFRPRTSMR